MLLVSNERRGLFYILVMTLMERVCASPKIEKGSNRSDDGAGYFFGLFSVVSKMKQARSDPVF